MVFILRWTFPTADRFGVSRADSSPCTRSGLLISRGTYMHMRVPYKLYSIFSSVKSIFKFQSFVHSNPNRHADIIPAKVLYRIHLEEMFIETKP